MSNNSTINAIIGIAGLLGIGYGIAMHTKLSKISNRLDKSIDDLADNMEIDIPEEMVNRAVEKAVSHAAKTAVEKATTQAIAELKRDIQREVSIAVEKEYSSIKDNVLKEATLSASKIDVARVRRDIEAAAKKMALDKFDYNLDDILQKFNCDLDNTAKIYQAIRTMMVPNSGTSSNNTKEVILRVG